MSEKLASSHGNIGTSKENVEKLLNDHDKLAENAKVYTWHQKECPTIYKAVLGSAVQSSHIPIHPLQKTYKYGCDLLSAAQRSRQASRLDQPNNASLLADLTSLWEGLSGALVEARARLEVAQQFHHLADEVSKGRGLLVM